MPTPPVGIVNAPEVALVLFVAEVITMLPLLFNPVSVPTLVIFACAADDVLNVPVNTVPILPISKDFTLAAIIPALKILRPLYMLDADCDPVIAPLTVKSP